jgi:hypothetical protein
MFRAIATVACLVSIVSVPVIGQVAKIYPVDEAARDPEFFAFRARLLIALQQRDVEFLYGILAPNILNSFGGDGGVDEFRMKWRPEESTSKVWTTLTEILAMGGQFRPSSEWSGSRTFVAPYTFSVTPAAGSDGFEYGVVIGRDVRVRQQPDRASPILATLTFDVVRVTDWTPKPEANESGARSWAAVQLTDGRSGYVASEFIRSRIGYRAIFVLSDGRWLLRAFVAGD